MAKAGARLPKITRRHRSLACKALDRCAIQFMVSDVTRIARALADIEAETIAAAPSATLLAQMANVLWNLGRGAEFTDHEREICKRLAAEYDASRKGGE